MKTLTLALVLGFAVTASAIETSDTGETKQAQDHVEITTLVNSTMDLMKPLTDLEEEEDELSSL